MEGGFQAGPDGLGVATDHAVGVLVDHAAVVEDVEHLVLGRVDQADLGHQDLHLHRLHLVREDLPEHLGVGVGEAAGVDVFPAVLVALEVGVADPGDAELVELVVLADAGEGDAVVDLAHLVQGGRAVLGGDEDAVGVEDGDCAATAGDALAGVVGPILHHLLGGDVERHRHADAPPAMMASTLVRSSASSTRS